MQRMRNKTCVVTGGASGIGLATVQRLAEEGGIVWLTDAEAEHGQAVAAELASHGLAVHFHALDVSRREQWEQVFGHIRAAGHQPEVLVNNAGIVIPGTIESTDLASWRRTLAVNLDGVFLGTQLGVQAMKDRGGAIINLASIEGLLGEPLALAYNASKGAVRLLSRSAAVHCARSGYGIRINAVCPGFVETPLVRDALASQPAEVAQALLEKVMQRTPMGRMAQPHEVAAAVAYLASDDAAYVTGSDLMVDGGYTAG